MTEAGRRAESHTTVRIALRMRANIADRPLARRPARIPPLGAARGVDLHEQRTLVRLLLGGQYAVLWLSRAWHSVVHSRSPNSSGRRFRHHEPPCGEQHVSSSVSSLHVVPPRVARSQCRRRRKYEIHSRTEVVAPPVQSNPPLPTTDITHPRPTHSLVQHPTRQPCQAPSVSTRSSSHYSKPSQCGMHC